MTAMLRVKEAMRVELSPCKVEVTVGESVVLSCKVSHDPSLEVGFQWLLNQQPLNFQQEGGHFEYIQRQSSTVDLMIRSILLQHAGKYSCRAQTSADTLFAEAEVLVRGELINLSSRQQEHGAFGKQPEPKPCDKLNYQGDEKKLTVDQ
ncbi:contactin-5-like [Oncorhynchus keta]|uniref:contactin-5-like n=1 Tax=Oncorhynchus keta TaxID=8018 RepID=UPI00227C80F0|nr:contactin-5-like [Oncorhynchus keta]